MCRTLKGSLTHTLEQRLCSMPEDGKHAMQMKEEPHGVEKEAQLLTEFAEIPSISSALIGPASANGNQITVRTPL